jgi:hypothetical protein
METNAQVQPSEFLDTAVESPPSQPPIDAPVDVNVTGSENNAFGWMAYLPDDDIKKMVELEWKSALRCASMITESAAGAGIKSSVEK